MGLPRVAPKDGITIGDRTFPEGTTLSINPWYVSRPLAAARNSGSFPTRLTWDSAQGPPPLPGALGPGRRPMEPRPVARRRRRGPGEELDSGKQSRRRPFLSAEDPKLTRIKFGAGWMGCPGQHVARMELSKVCSTVRSTQRKRGCQKATAAVSSGPRATRGRFRCSHADYGAPRLSVTLISSWWIRRRSGTGWRTSPWFRVLGRCTSPREHREGPSEALLDVEGRSGLILEAHMPPSMDDK